MYVRSIITEYKYHTLNVSDLIMEYKYHTLHVCVV